MPWRWILGGVGFLSLISLSAILLKPSSPSLQKASSEAAHREPMEYSNMGSSSEALSIDSVTALVRDEQELRGKLIRLTGTIDMMHEDNTVQFASGESDSNWHVLCQSSATQQQQFQSLAEGQTLTVVGTLPSGAPSAGAGGVIELSLRNCQPMQTGAPLPGASASEGRPQAEKIAPAEAPASPNP